MIVTILFFQTLSAFRLTPSNDLSSHFINKYVHRYHDINSYIKTATSPSLSYSSQSARISLLHKRYATVIEIPSDNNGDESSDDRCGVAPDEAYGPNDEDIVWEALRRDAEEGMDVMNLFYIV